MKRRRLLANLAAIVGGVALFAAFPPFGIWPLAVVGIALFVGLFESRSWFGSFWIGMLFGFSFFLPLFEWTRIASGVVIAQVALAFAESLYIGFMAIAWQGLMRGKHRITCGSACGDAACGVGSLRTTAILLAIWWHAMGNGGLQSGLQPSGAFGAVGIRDARRFFFVVVIAVLLQSGARVVAERRLGTAIIAVTCGGALLWAPMFLPLASRADRYIAVGLVQGIIPDETTLAPEQSRALTVTENLVSATENLTGEPDVVFWPESASDRDPREDADARALIEQSSEELGVPLVLGTQRYPGDNRYNEYAVWMPDGTISDLYAKQHPVPFGEYMPYKDFFRSFTDAVDLVSIDMLAGNEPAVLNVPLDDGSLRIATPICFEISYSQIVAEAVRGGAELIVVPTNNASFGESAESRQQFDMTRFRAIEHGRTAIQISTVGVSGVVEPNGVVRDKTEPWTEDARTVRVGLRSEMTFAAQHSAYLLIGTYVAGAILSLVGIGQLIRYRAPWRKEGTP